MLKANKFLDLIRKITRDLRPDSISVRLNGPAVTAEQEKFLADDQKRGNIKNAAKIGPHRRLYCVFNFLFFSLLCLSTGLNKLKLSVNIIIFCSKKLTPRLHNKSWSDQSPSCYMPSSCSRSWSSNQQLWSARWLATMRGCIMEHPRASQSTRGTGGGEGAGFCSCPFFSFFPG